MIQMTETVVCLLLHSTTLVIGDAELPICGVALFSWKIEVVSQKNNRWDQRPYENQCAIAECTN
jgi:hypothetical protein